MLAAAERRIGLADRFALITTVELTRLEKGVERWLRFGQAVADTILDRQRRTLSFAPGSVFAFIRWAANDYGTVGSGEDYQTVPCMQPGGEILLHQSTWPPIQRVLEAVDAVEAQDIDPTQVCPDYWQHVHHRLEARQQPDAYTKARHQAWLRRRALQGACRPRLVCRRLAAPFPFSFRASLYVFQTPF